MKIFNKTAIALSLSLLGATSTLSAIAMATDDGLVEKLVEIHQVKIEKDDGEANVYVNINGAETEFTIDKADLSDTDKLSSALDNVPEALREKILSSLSGIHSVNNQTVLNLEDEHFSDDVNWISEDGENKVVVMSFDRNMDHVSDVSQQVVKGMFHSGQHVMKFPKGKLTADRVINMLSNDDFSVDELNKIQAALDAKR